MTGIVVRLIADKGFGFIKDDHGIEYFFHRSAVRGVAFEDLRIDMTVFFDVEKNPKGPRATNVSVPT